MCIVSRHDCNSPIRIRDATYEAMKIVVNYFYNKKLFHKKDISRELLEELLTLAHFFDLQELVFLATSQISYMVMNPRLRFSVRRHNEDLKKWLDFAVRQQISYTKNCLSRELGLRLLGHIHL